MEPDSLPSPSPAPVPGPVLGPVPAPVPISPNDEAKEEAPMPPMPPMPPNDEVPKEAAFTNKRSRIQWWTVAIPCIALFVFGICFFVINNFDLLYIRFEKLSRSIQQRIK